MRERTVKIGGLSDAIKEIVEKYADEVADGIDEAALDVAKKCKDDISQRASTLFEQHSGAQTYYKQWTYKQTGEGRGKAQYTVYCKKPGLPHLLENGHAKVNGGRVEGRPHIGPAEATAKEEFQRRVEELIKDAGG